MLNKELKIFFLLGYFMLASTPIALCLPSVPIIYVAGDGSGDFNCDGNDDHVQINQALQLVAENPDYTTVYLKGPFTYIIDDSLLIGSNTILEGDSSAKIKPVSNAGWAAWKPMIRERSSGSHDITIRGFTIDGNREGNTNVVSGKGYYNLIHLTGCQNINVYNMYLTNNHGDGLKTDKCSNIKFYDNRIYLLGHDGLYASTCSGVEAYNNKITCRTNSALRLYNTNKASLHDNVITSEGSGGAGIEIQKYETPTMDDIEVFNNVIYKTALAGIWMFGSGSYPTYSANVYIHHNQIYDTGTRSTTGVRGGIVSNGFNGLIENNAIDGAYGAGIAQKHSYSLPPLGSGFVLTVRNNIITNTRSGAGINNVLTGTHSLFLQNNCLYGNEGGDYIGVQAAPSDIASDPQYADRNNHDYHLKSKSGRWDGSGWVTDSISSPCIDAGYSSSDYSVEPEDNGDRINIGPDGGTIYASKSGTSTTNEGQAPVIDSIPEAIIETGESLNFIVKASDADGDRLTYSDTDLPAGANLDRDSGLFNWTPAEGQEGTYRIIFEVSDGKFNDPENARIIVFKNENSSNLSNMMHDNSLLEALPEDVFQDRQSIDVGDENGVGRYRSLVWFNLSEYTDPGEISNATLYLYWYSPDSVRQEDTVIEIYRPASAWNSSYVSWNLSDSSVLWNNPGGDWFDKNNVSQGDTPYATITLKGSDLPDKRYYELDLTDLVRECISGKYENTGFLIKAHNESNNSVAFYSKEGGDKKQRPRLTITKKVAVNITIAGAIDNRLRESTPDDILQDKPFIDVGGMSKARRYRDVMWFNLSEYTGPAEIVNATLSLYWFYPERSRPEDTVIEIYRPASAWNSSYVSWNKKNKDIPWNNSGGDWYDKNGILQGSTPYTTLILRANDFPSNSYCEFNVTDLVKEYVSGKSENTGLFIKARNETDNYVAFYSNDWVDEGQQPMLRIIYS